MIDSPGGVVGGETLTYVRCEVREASLKGSHLDDDVSVGSNHRKFRRKRSSSRKDSKRGVGGQARTTQWLEPAGETMMMMSEHPEVT